jgi:hypothetical protein
MQSLNLLITAQKMGGHFIHGEIYLIQGVLCEQKEN